MVGHERVMTSTIILVCYYTEINQLPFQKSMSLLRIDTGGCSVIRATPVFIRLLIYTHQLQSNFVLS